MTTKDETEKIKRQMQIKIFNFAIWFMYPVVLDDFVY